MLIEFTKSKEKKNRLTFQAARLAGKKIAFIAGATLRLALAALHACIIVALLFHGEHWHRLLGILLAS